MGCGASQPLEEERRSLVSEGKPGASPQWSRAEYENGGGVHQRAPSPRRGGNNGDGWRQSPRPAEDEEPTSPRRPTKKTRTPRGHNLDHDDAQSMEQMALALAMTALKQDNHHSSGNSSGHSRGDEEAKARALATAMVAWVEAHLAEGRAIGRPPRHNFCFKCGAALHAAATFCADCGLKLPREGDTESWREREARLKREREEKERKEEEDRKRRTDEFNSTGAHSSPAKLEASRPKPRPMKKDMSGLSLLGETEEQFRKRQNLERQESQQTLYGLDAELREKEREKLSMAEYRKLVDDAMLWLERILGDRGVGEFPDNLKSGRVLCGLINKFWPGMIPQVGDRPIPLIERENIRFYLEACEKVGVRKQDLFVISDLYEERYLAGVILNLYALAPIIQRQSSFSGPVLVRYA